MEPGGCAYIFVYRILPPFPYNLISTFEGLPRFLDEIGEQAQLTRDEVGIMGVSCPSTDIDDIQGLVDQVADGCQLPQNQIRCCRSGGEAEGI